MNKTQLTLKQVNQVASIAAKVAIGGIRHEIHEVVRNELPTVAKSLDKTADPPKYLRVRLSPPPLQKPQSNYTQVLMESAEWRHGRGACLGSVWLYKPSTQEKLLVEQYELECSVMQMDKAQPSAKFDTMNRLVEPGRSVWTKFSAMKGVIEDVVARLKTKGWVLQESVPRKQLALVDAP